MVNPFPPGGAADVVGRPLAAALEPILKQPVVIETKAGAAGQVGAQYVATPSLTATRCWSTSCRFPAFAEVDKLFGRTPKFTRADFIPIARLTAGPMVLLVNDQQPYKTLKDLVDDAKASRTASCSARPGSTARCICRSAAGEGGRRPKMRHLPTNGGGPALTAILGNNAQVLRRVDVGAQRQIKAGKLRPLAGFGATRSRRCRTCRR